MEAGEHPLRQVVALQVPLHPAASLRACRFCFPCPAPTGHGVGKVLDRNGEGLISDGRPSPPQWSLNRVWTIFDGEGPGPKNRPSPKQPGTFPSNPRNDPVGHRRTTMVMPFPFSPEASVQGLGPPATKNRLFVSQGSCRWTAGHTLYRQPAGAPGRSRLPGIPAWLWLTLMAAPHPHAPGPRPPTAQATVRRPPHTGPQGAAVPFPS